MRVVVFTCGIVVSESVSAGLWVCACCCFELCAVCSVCERVSSPRRVQRWTKQISTRGQSAVRLLSSALSLSILLLLIFFLWLKRKAKEQKERAKEEEEKEVAFLHPRASATAETVASSKSKQRQRETQRERDRFG